MEENDKENQISQELATKIAIPKPIREAIYTKLFKNLIIAILIFIYFIFLNLGYIRLNRDVFETDLHMFDGILIISTIIVFELAYRKDSGEIALYGVELLVLSILTLFLPYVYFHRGFLAMTLYAFSAMYISIYYVIKCIFIYIREVRKYKNGLSDIKEIVSKEENASYLDEKNYRKFIDLEDRELTDEILSENKE